MQHQKTIIGLFDSFDEARGAVDELLTLGIDRNDMRLENESKGEFAFGTHHETEGTTNPGLIDGLSRFGVPKNDSMIYAEAVTRGSTLLIVQTSDGLAERVLDVLGRHGAVDLDERMEMWRKSGWTGFEGTTSTKAMKSKGKVETKARGLTGREEVIPVVEEELTVGKREIMRGGVRLYTHVIEKPVEETVRLREETVRVERRPVDRAVGTADLNAFKDTTLEVREMAEEAVVSKRARVIEEVIIEKEVGERTETIRDTVRRTDVDIQPMAGQAKVVGETKVTGVARFEDFDRDFRTLHTKHLGSSGMSYDECLPVYRYGYTLGTDRRFGDKDWTAIETDARTRWEKTNPGTWEQFKDAIRSVRDRVRTRL